MRQRIVRFVASLGLLAGLVLLPATTVMACSCAFPGYPEAIADADAAFIGTVEEVDEPPLGTGIDARARYLLSVERAKEPMTSPVEITSWFGDGSSCGLDLDVGQRWLILASVQEGVLTTHLCHASAPWDDADPELQRIVEPLLDTLPTASTSIATEAALPSVPMPVILATGALGAILGVSVLAFRRAR